MAITLEDVKKECAKSKRCSPDCIFHEKGYGDTPCVLDHAPADWPLQFFNLETEVIKDDQS